MPLLQQFHEEYGDRVGVLGIDWQDPQVESAMAELVVDSGVTYPLLADPDAELGTVDGMAVRGLPGAGPAGLAGSHRLPQPHGDRVGDSLVGLVNRYLATSL